MRAASPPLLLPSTSHRTDIPEAEIPPWKRACFATPAPGFEIGESSAAGAVEDWGVSALALDREAVYARIAWTGSKERSAAIKAHTQLTIALGRIETLEARDPEPQDGPTEAGSSC
ncbi:hypothetical protein Tco_1385979 [Tanacetum coccineum]